MSANAHERALELLGQDPLRHIVSLKMLTRLGERSEVHLVEAQGGWAHLLTFPSDIFEYDARVYGPGRSIAVIEGSLDGAIEGELLSHLPAGDVVIKTHHPLLARHAIELLGAAPVTAFLSFTAYEHTALMALPDERSEVTAGVSSSADLTAEMRAFFARNGYVAAELEGYFAGGARWFAIACEGELAAACFIFRNFESVWEIAGVHTDIRWRRKGLAAQVVRAAARHLLGAGLRPRYQTEVSNLKSLQLARRVGLVEFLRIEHLLLCRAS